ncbi:hypothetical protein ACIGKQ_16595 [Gordonia sp. NPDC062954]|uniref:hypothetical protein n=1 Tax=unclassified Gordonia (in: high G+C Gram-positive bacteria) TaxID=2657482 RepID=UPI000C3F3457|nr:hypothetical protein [Gordonia sp. (in: high G+C Gram-positive bacteria)]MAU83413.1 hypothetical protein [Gordonia sp. (in: high G+C Gram-positive bacteria)]
MPIEWNSGWEDQLANAIGGQLNQVGASLQSMLETVSHDFSGHPVDDVRSALASRWAEATGEAFAEPGLTAAAEAVSRGGRIVIESGSVVAYEPGE